MTHSTRTFRWLFQTIAAVAEGTAAVLLTLTLALVHSRVGAPGPAPARST